jgi:hypothetical protein
MNFDYLLVSGWTALGYNLTELVHPDIFKLIHIPRLTLTLHAHVKVHIINIHIMETKHRSLVHGLLYTARRNKFVRVTGNCNPEQGNFAGH